MTTENLRDLISAYLRPFVESATSYVSSAILILHNLNWTAVGGIILFAARACVDIPKAYDYWKKRRQGNG